MPGEYRQESPPLTGQLVPFRGSGMGRFPPDLVLDSEEDLFGAQ
ncbi:hypothetical protein RIdsm_02203 [Roseovarius indicus]|uniref:Uncharacterized protein n=1 Tax=Roseovarius indicus TaxID=540747 RepID=A0A5P3AC97_9RHOB|nr:hypothetical protein RIdsm_02203 [Roseovarius indicus]SFE63599.1 hypothetical protein SAMN04488031_11480 [Roseovarius indicus]